MKKITFLSIFLCFSISLTAQHQQVNNNWYFGKNAGVTFNNASSPTALSNGNTDKLWAPATVSDNNGAVLFYTDGRNVWGKNHVEMPNSGNIATAFKKETTTMQTLIAPSISNSNLYYLFTHNADTGFRYNTVDMTGNGGNGSISPAPSHLFNTNGTTNLDYGNIDQFDAEGNFTSYYNADTKVIWVVLYHKTELLIYKIDETNGLNTTAQVAVPLSDLTTNSNFTHLGLKKNVRISPDGSRIAVSNQFLPSAPGASPGNDVIVTSFDAVTGTIDTNNVIEIDASEIRGIEFSPDSNRLYMQSRTTVFTLPGTKQSAAKGNKISLISAVDLNSQSRMSKSAMAMTPHNLFMLPNGNSGSIQLGPDNHIWFTNVYVDPINPSISTSYLGILDNPNTTNLTMPNPLDFRPQELLLTSGSAGIGQVLPQKVFQVENCPVFPKEIRGIDINSSSTLTIDSSNNLIVSGVSNNNIITLDNQPLADKHFVAKYNEEGCLLWVTYLPYDRSRNIKTDSNNNILVLTNSDILYKLSSEGDLIWTHSGSNVNYLSYDLDSSDNIYLMAETNIANQSDQKIIKIDGNNGSIIMNPSTSITINYTNGLIGSFSKNIVLSQNTNTLFVMTYIDSNVTVNFNGSIINHDGGNEMDAVILKYSLSGNSITPNSYIYIDTNNYPSDILLNDFTNHIFVGARDLDSYTSIFTLNYNLTLLNQNLVPFLQNDKAKSMSFNNSLNELTILGNGGIHKLKDDGLYNITSTLNTIATGDIDSFQSFVQTNSGILFALSLATDISSLNPEYNQINKIDPNSGQHLERTSALKEVSNKEVIPAKTINIHPNPFNEMVHIQSSKKTGISAVSLVNLVGKTVLRQKINTSNKTVNINTEGLKNGIYFIKIIFTDGSYEVQRMIKE